MRYRDLTELRREHPVNVKAVPRTFGHQAAVDFLRQQPHLTDLGVTMTHVPKVGVNPRSRFNSPLGVYYYPASYYLSTIESGELLPFAHDRGFVNVIAVPKPRLRIDTLDIQQKNHWIQQCEQAVKQTIADRLPPQQIQFFINDAVRNQDQALVNNPGGQLWYVTWKLSQLFSPVKRSSTRIFWNWLWQKIGIAAVEDQGQGIIYPDQPSQGVVLATSQTINVVKRMSNY